jgi:hypothetical protein
LKNPAQRAALRSAGLHGFVLAPRIRKRRVIRSRRRSCGNGRKSKL